MRDGKITKMDEVKDPVYPDPNAETDAAERLKGRQVKYERLVPKLYVGASFDNFEATDKASQSLRELGQKFANIVVDYIVSKVGNPKNLIFYGPPGTGKTHLACAIMRHVHFSTTANPSVIRITGQDIRYLDSNMSVNVEQVIKDIRTLKQVPLLVIDDIAKQNLPSTKELLFDVISSRCENALPTIAITNLSDKAFSHLDERVYSRLVGNGFLIRFTGDDHRLSAKKHPRLG